MFWNSFFLFFLPPPPFPSFLPLLQVWAGLGEAAGDCWSVHSMLRSSISALSLNLSQSLESFSYPKIHSGDFVPISALCPDLLPSLYKVICAYSFYFKHCWALCSFSGSSFPFQVYWFWKYFTTELQPWSIYISLCSWLASLVTCLVFLGS